MQFNNPLLNKKTKYDNFTVKKCGQTVAFAIRFISHSARESLTQEAPTTYTFRNCRHVALLRPARPSRLHRDAAGKSDPMSSRPEVEPLTWSD